MAGGLFARLKTWINDEDLYHDDLNGEFDNIISNLKPEEFDDYSADVATMQTQTSPGSQGSESLPTSLAGEIARLRYKLNQIMGATYWYDTPAISLSSASSQLSALSTAGPNNRLVSGRVRTGSNMGVFVVPSGTTNSVTIKGTTTNLIYYVAGTQKTLASDVVKTGLTAAFGVTNTCTVNDATIDNSAWTKYAGEDVFFPTNYAAGGTVLPRTITVNAMGANVQTLIGKYAVFKAGTEYFIAFVQSTTVLSHIRRGYFFDSADAPLARTTINNGATLTVMSLAYLFLDTSGAVTAVNTGSTSNADPIVSGIAPASPTTGDFWFDTAAQIWKKYTGAAWADSLSTIVGVCVTNSSSVTVAARSLDFYKVTDDKNELGQLVRTSADEMRNSNPGAQISVNGTTVNFQGSLVKWKISVDVDSGESLGVASNSFLYLTEAGKSVISTVGPYDRSQDLKGFYHPYQMWRCVGYCYNDDASTFSATLFVNAPTVQSPDILDNSITTKKILDGSVTPAKRSTAVIGSSGLSSGAFTTSSATYVDVTNCTASLVSTGRPIVCMVTSDSIGAFMFVVGGTTTVNINIAGSNYEATYVFSGPYQPTAVLLTPTAGATITGKLQLKCSSGTCGVNNAVMVMFEL